MDGSSSHIKRISLISNLRPELLQYLINLKFPSSLQKPDKCSQKGNVSGF
jgi:hypothetical protein